MDQLLAALGQRFKANGFDPRGRFELRQVKEKFGCLRIYTSGFDVRDLLQAAEAQSAAVCMVCGEAGKMVVSGHWFHVVCSRHMREGDLTPAQFQQRIAESRRPPLPGSAKQQGEEK